MKAIFKLFIFILTASLLVIACDKKDSLPYYNAGKATALTLSTTTVAPAPSDSDNIALSVSWTSPNYATDSSTVKYVIQIDSSGRNFSKAVAKTVTGALTASFTAKELNTIALGYGFAFNTAYSLDVRVVSSYANNNDQQVSNTVTIQYTPYKIPPKVPLPLSGELYLVGSASAGGWSNPVPTPSQKFAQLNETTWAGVFQLSSGGEYLILPQNGDWSHKYAVPDKTAANISEGGSFGYDASDNFQSPATDGLYVITLDFQAGTFTVTPYAGGALPDSLFIVGDATAGGWNNPVPTPTQEFTRLNSSQFELTLPLTGGKNYLLLPTNGSWDHKFAIDDPSANTATSGTFAYDASSNFTGPADDGTYKIDLNFITNTYTLTKQ